MRGQLAALLTSLGVPGMSAVGSWKRVVLVRNFAAVPEPAGQPAWGFKFLLLGEDMTPAWFGRCSWATADIMEREATLLQALVQDPVGALHVPETRTAVGSDMTVQISRYISPLAYDKWIARRTPAQWLADVEGILDTAERVLGIVQRELPYLFGPDPEQQRRELLAEDFATLRVHGVPADLLERWQGMLKESLRRFPVVLQHGDLWPANVLSQDERWWLIDFTECGLVWLPGYDLFHLLTNSPTGFSTQWLIREPALGSNPWHKARYQIVERFAARNGWTSEMLGVCVMLFLLRLTAYRMRPGVSATLSEHWVAELLRVDNALNQGRTPGQLLRALS